jgi:hypothetical protein
MVKVDGYQIWVINNTSVEQFVRSEKTASTKMMKYYFMGYLSEKCAHLARRSRGDMTTGGEACPWYLGKDGVPI